MQRTWICRLEPWLRFFLRMAEEITGEPSTEWRCTGHVVRVEAMASTRGFRGVGVEFDCYQVSKY